MDNEDKKRARQTKIIKDQLFRELTTGKYKQRVVKQRTNYSRKGRQSKWIDITDKDED